MEIEEDINVNGVFGDYETDLLKRFEVGLIGAEFKLFTFNLGYEYGLSNISQAAVDIHNRNAFFTIGYRFF